MVYSQSSFCVRYFRLILDTEVDLALWISDSGCIQLTAAAF